MKKTILFIIYCLLFTVCSSYAQVPADSLPGIYIGQYWLANPYTNPWVKTPDTMYVSNVDSSNCTQLDNSNHILGANNVYYTDYYSCNSPAPTNGYVKFYSGDSVRLICDTCHAPPPYYFDSWRFYGKRIPGTSTVGIKELLNNEQIIIYPNPCTGEFTIYNLQSSIYILCLYNILGEEISNEKVRYCTTYNAHYDLPKGIYFLKISNEKEFIIRKIIIN